MKSPSSKMIRDVRGVSAIEFALVLPVLLMMLGGLADFSLAFWTKGVLTGSVAQGEEYALLAGPQVSTSAVRDIVRQKLGLAVSDVDVPPPSCNCISGTPATAVQQICLLPCPNGALPGTYIKITARYKYKSLLPFYSQVSNPVLTETAWVKLK